MEGQKRVEKLISENTHEIARRICACMEGNLVLFICPDALDDLDNDHIDCVEFLVEVFLNFYDTKRFQSIQNAMAFILENIKVNCDH